MARNNNSRGGNKVGYRNPRIETQFKPGQSGNPKGKVKGSTLTESRGRGILREVGRILRRFVFSMRGLRWIFEPAAVKNGLGCMSRAL